MKNLIRIEEVGMVLLSLLMFAETEFAWWLYPALFLAPDISMIGYAVSPRIGAFFYNLFHHKGVAVFIYASGYFFKEPYLLLAGAILFGHSAFDRLLGYGLKLPDSFKHTHLGRIGQK